MKPRQDDPTASASTWKKLMESALQRTESQTASILVLGDQKSGKRSLLHALLTRRNQFTELTVPNERSVLAEAKRRGETPSIFDFRYLRVNRFEDDNLNELGRLHFYSLNEKYAAG